MARLSVVASPFAILPLTTTQFCPLAPLLLQKLVPSCLSIHPDHRISSVMPSSAIALSPVRFYELFPYLSGVLVS